MPVGVPKGKVNCKKCGKTFPSFSPLRKHQWAFHREIFNNLRKPETIKKRIASLREAKLAKLNGSGPQVAKGELSALELLDKLKEQQLFMNNVVSLISGILNRPLT
jgi:hypothetical protein